MRYLVDTNIWLERLLDQEKSEDVRRFLVAIPPTQLILTDFSLHSLGVILSRLKKQELFLQFVNDVLLNGHVALQSVPADMMRYLNQAMERFNLDFDDAYQYIVAQHMNAIIVSFDKDFDRTELGRKVPRDLF